MKDWQAILESVITQSIACGATHADAVWVDHTDVSLSCRLGKLEGLERSQSQAFSLRVLVGEGQAIVSSTNHSATSLSLVAQRAVDMARLAPADPLTQFAPSSRYPTVIPDLDLCDPQEPEADWLFAQAERAEQSARTVAGITNSEGADANYGRSNIGLMIARDGVIGFSHGYATSHASLSASVLAGSGTDMQRDYDFSSARHTADLKTPESIGMEAASRALKRMHPRKIASETLPVIYDRRVSRSLLSAFSSCVLGSQIVRGASFLREDMGKHIFSSQIQITDDPMIMRGLASKPFDGEGVATQALHIVQDGRLKSWITDMRSSHALGLTSTGHATRGMGGAPSPSSTNLYMHAGPASVETLMRDMKRGLWITETFGTGINTITGDYSQGASGFMIENGAVAYPVAEITIAGHLRDMFARLVPANDLHFDYATNAPSLLIDGMSVAGA